jgi:pimeloyl-ACP methyl ester carboxylesterase
VPADPPTRFLYAHDGQNLFSPAAPNGGWRPDLAAASTTLIVGIDNTASRFAEYTHVPDYTLTGGALGDAYADYVEQVVRPLIEARYGVPARTGVMGSSLGGLISLFIDLRFPGRYDFVASLSGTVGWGSINPGNPATTVIELFQALPACPVGALYLDAGGGPGTTGCLDSDVDGIFDDGNGADNYCENVQLRDVLAALGCGASLRFAWEPGASHDEAAWKYRVSRPGGVLDLFEAL